MLFACFLPLFSATFSCALRFRVRCLASFSFLLSSCSVFCCLLLHRAVHSLLSVFFSQLAIFCFVGFLLFTPCWFHHLFVFAHSCCLQSTFGFAALLIALIIASAVSFSLPIPGAPGHPAQSRCAVGIPILGCWRGTKTNVL